MTTLVLMILLISQIGLNVWLWGVLKRYQEKELDRILAQTERLKKIVERP